MVNQRTMRWLLLCCVLPTVLQGVLAEEDNPCKGILTGILVHEEYCYKYISCYKEVAEVNTCPPDKIFSVDHVTCVPGDQETCIEGEPEEPEEENPCRGIVLGRFPHPESCNQFLACIVGRMQERTCPNGSIFSQRTFTCVPGNADSCEVWSIPTTTTPAPGQIRPIPLDYCLRYDRMVGRLQHPQLCSRFVMCTVWVPEERECPSWTVFHDRFSLCLPGNPNTCQTIIGPGATTPAPNPPAPPLPGDICNGVLLVGLVPHPTYCYMYVSCVLGVGTARECPPYTVFSKQYSMCLPGSWDTCEIYVEL